MLRILDRYILREVVVSWFAVTGVLLAILLTNQVARVLERAAESQYPRGVVLELILLGAVQNLSLVIPVGLLIGIVLALGRLYHDSELTAAQACGAGSRPVFVPVVGFTLVLAILVAAVSLYLSPAAAGRMLELRSEALRAGQFAPITAGRFRMFGGGSTVVYAQGADADGTLQRVFVERDRGGHLEIALAQRATHAYSEGGDLQVITLYDGERFEGIPGERRFRIVRFAENTIPVRLPVLSDGAVALEGAPTRSLLQARWECAGGRVPLAHRVPAHGAGAGRHRDTARTPAPPAGPLRARRLRCADLLHLHQPGDRRPPGPCARRDPAVVRPVVGARRRGAAGGRHPAVAALARARSLPPQPARGAGGSPGGAGVNLLDRYVIRALLGGVFVVLAVLLALGALFLFANQQDDIGVGTYTALDAFWFVLLNLPQQIYELMPIAVLIGALLGLGTLARGSELTVMRAAGISVWRIAGSVTMAGVLLMLLAVLCGEFLAPPMQDMAKRQKALSKFSNISFASRGGAWVRDGNLLINVMQQSGRAEFGGMRIYELTPDHQLASVGTASTASVQPDGSWKLTRFAITRFGGEVIESDHVASRDFVSAVGGDFLGLTVVQPRQLESRVLWELVRHLKENGLDAKSQEFAFWSRIARTTAILFTALLAVPFVFGSLRSAGSGARLLIGVLIGLAFFFAQRVLESGALVFDASPMVMAWVPTAVLAAAALLFIARTR